MPVYFFDRSEDGESRGDYEMEFANVDEACREVLRALAEIARDELLTGNHRELAIHIRENGGCSRSDTIEPKTRSRSRTSNVALSPREMSR
jgi:hypothetical protein